MSLNLASLDGYSTPVWPPAGLALGFAVIFGKKVWPAIFLGALFTNTPQISSIENFISLILQNPQNITISFGNATSALLGAFLLKKYSLTK